MNKYSFFALLPASLTASTKGLNAMMIEDEELRNLYKVASSEHIQKIETGILHLEKHPQDTARLEEMLREAHSLKGERRLMPYLPISSRRQAGNLHNLGNLQNLMPYSQNSSKRQVSNLLNLKTLS
jgi:hypothetical protein